MKDAHTEDVSSLTLSWVYRDQVWVSVVGVDTISFL